MQADIEKALEDRVRKRIGSLRTSELPVMPLDLSDLMMLILCKGDHASIVQTIIRIATKEFGLEDTINGIDLPKGKQLPPEAKIEVNYINPSYYQGIPELSPRQAYRRHHTKHKGAE